MPAFTARPAGPSLRGMRTFPAAAFLLATLSAVPPAAAQPLRDAATGLAVDPPPGYAASPMAMQGAQQARMAVRRPQDTDTGCQVAFVPAPQNESLRQDDLNRLARAPGWRRVLMATLQPLYNVISVEGFAQGAVEGVLLVAELRPRPELPQRGQELRTLFAIVETPRGRTTTVCTEEKPRFATRRSEFEAVARGVAPPR